MKKGKIQTSKYHDAHAHIYAFNDISTKIQINSAKICWIGAKGEQTLWAECEDLNPYLREWIRGVGDAAEFQPRALERSSIVMTWLDKLS